MLTVKPKAKKKAKPEGVVFSEFASTPLNWEMPEYMKMTEKLLCEKPNKIFFYHRKAGRNIAYQMAKEAIKTITTEREARRNSMTPLEKFDNRFFNSLYEDHLKRLARCKERSKLMHIIDKKAKKKELSEFHKRPYLKVIIEEVKGKPQGEENIEKIEFPCYCSYVNGGKIYFGELNHSRYYGLFRIDKQDKYNFVDEMSSLTDLIRVYDINILKAEVKLWKEVGEYTKKE